MKHGDFTGLASNYAEYRPSYAPSVLTALVSLVGKPVEEIDAVDVGAGTGIWTRMVAAAGCRTVIAVEPNDDMREHRARDRQSSVIQWRKGNGEDTGLPAASADFLSMASSFHWVDTDRGLREFHRVIRPGGRFVALWNPRYIEDNPLLVEIEARLHAIAPELKRVSSGRSGITEQLTRILCDSPLYDDVVYIEGRHQRHMTPARYHGAWRSVNDVRVQVGEKRFEGFLNYVADRTSGLATIETTYLTRAWTASRAG